jgi:preprotein translocase subunit SecD
VIKIINTTALLEWKLVRGGPAPDTETLLQEYGGEIPEDMEVLKGDPQRTEGGYYLLSSVSVITGKDLRSARRSVDEWNNPAVSFTLDSDGAKRFDKFTSENIGKPLSIVLDGRVQSVATIQDRISDSGIIHGRFTIEDADDLALILRAGALPASIKTLENRTIGPSLGADSVRQGLSATILALILVLSFMAFYYRLSGFNAIAALVLNMIFLMGALAYFKATLTLPGIAGIILTIGMAIDANVLVFERIREELALGKSVISAIATGFSRAFRTILDANVTTIIAAVFLFQFGTGPVKGFAVTLIIGISASMFTAVFVSRLIFELVLSKRKRREKLSI